MGCQNEVILNDNLTFSVATHRPDTGELTDADSPPAYRIYEDEVETPILTGAMAILDDVNTTGFYTSQVACTVANGFENGKSYTIYIETTINGDTGGISYGFLVRTIANEVWTYSPRTLTQTVASIISTISGTAITCHRGDTFIVSLDDLGDISNRTKLWFTVKKYPVRDTDPAAIVQIEESAGLIYVNGLDASSRSSNGTIVVDDENAGDITITLDEAETDDLKIYSKYEYDIQMLDNSNNVFTLTSGIFTVRVTLQE